MAEYAFSMTCPGCNAELDIPEGEHAIPPHPRPFDEKTASARPIGSRFPTPVIAIVTLQRLCKWSGALIERGNQQDARSRFGDSDGDR